MSKPAATLVEHFSKLPDPRLESRSSHLLIDILIIAICGAICGADGWVAIEEFGRAKQAWFKKFLKLPHGIPSHDTFGRVFALIRPEEFQACFRNWIASITRKLDAEIVAIDGKTARRSYDRNSGKTALHMVNAWALENQLVLGQADCQCGFDEITVIPELLRLLSVEGCIVTIDAIGCHKHIAEQIVEQEADYVLTVKENQPKLFAHIQQVFNRTYGHLWADSSMKHYLTDEESHGRIETRRYFMTDQIDDFEGRDAWKGLRSFGMVEAERLVDGRLSVERRYYITSLTVDAQQFARAVRGHWNIENGLHWVLDVAFQEDQSRIRTEHAQANLALLRHIAISLLKQEKTAKVGVQTKRLKAGWDNSYLAKVLSAHAF